MSGFVCGSPFFALCIITRSARQMMCLAHTKREHPSLFLNNVNCANAQSVDTFNKNVLTFSPRTWACKSMFNNRARDIYKMTHTIDCLSLCFFQWAHDRFLFLSLSTSFTLTAQERVKRRLLHKSLFSNFLLLSLPHKQTKGYKPLVVLALTAGAEGAAFCNSESACIQGSNEFW